MTPPHYASNVEPFAIPIGPQKLNFFQAIEAYTYPWQRCDHCTLLPIFTKYVQIKSMCEIGFVRAPRGCFCCPESEEIEHCYPISCPRSAFFHKTSRVKKNMNLIIGILVQSEFFFDFPRRFLLFLNPSTIAKERHLTKACCAWQSPIVDQCFSSLSTATSSSSIEHVLPGVSFDTNIRGIVGRGSDIHIQPFFAFFRHSCTCPMHVSYTCVAIGSVVTRTRIIFYINSDSNRDSFQQEPQLHKTKNR